MISDNGSNGQKRPLLVAVEDMVVIFLFAFLAALIATGSIFPPPFEVIYGALLAASMAGVISWAKARHVPVRP